MEQKGTEIPQIKEERVPADCPVPSPCPICPPKPKPRQIFLKILLVLLLAIILTFVILVGSGLRIVRKESLLDVLLASRKATPAPEVLTTPAPDPTAGWKTYTNEKWGYSVKYPSDWTYREFPSTRDGAGFRPLDKPNDVRYEFIGIRLGKRALDSINIPFEEYVKRVAIEEIQNYQSLVSIEKVPTKDGLVGYKTTWNVRSLEGGIQESLPITYFDYKNSSGDTVQVSIENNDYMNIYNQILSTFKFQNKEFGGSATEETPSGTEAKLINFEEIAGWLEYSSPTGYSIQYPSSFQPTAGGEEKRDGACYKYFSNNAGGVLMAKVVPYDGGSRRQLYGTESGYTYKYEEAVIQGQKSLIIEKGPIGDSGSGSGVVVPVGNKALILSWSNRAKDSPEFINLLKSVKLGQSLDLAKCQTL